MTELAVTVNRPGGGLEHSEVTVSDDTTVGDVRNEVGGDDIDAVMMHLTSDDWVWDEPGDMEPVTDLLDPDAEKSLLVFHPGGWEEIVGNPFDVHPRYKPRRETG